MMRYPILNYRYQFENNGQDIEMYNPITNDLQIISTTTYQLLMAFDGKTDPYQILAFYKHDEVDTIVDNLLNEKILLKNPYCFRDDDGLVINFYVRKNYDKPKANHLNYLLKPLIYLAPPLFIIGLTYFSKLPFNYLILGLNQGLIILTILISLIISVMIHELAHSLAIKAHNLYLLAIGIKLNPFLMGFNEYFTENKPSRSINFEIAIAGISANLIFSALCFAIAYYLDNGYFLLMAIQNITLAFVNMSFARGVDGAAALEALLDIDDLEDLKNKLWKIKFNKQLVKDDKNLMAYLCGLVIMTLSLINFPIMLIWCFVL